MDNTKDNIKPILYIAGGLLVLSAVSKLFQSIGIFKSPETKNIDQISDTQDTFWSPNFWKKYTTFNYSLTQAQAIDYLQQIQDSFGLFNDCEECVKGVFRKMRTKANVSYLADVFQRQGNGDLFTWLRGGWWPQDRLSDADLNEINSFLSQLPNN